MTAMPEFHTTADACAEAIIEAVGKNIVLGLPLGLGKANRVANALFARAKADPSIRLKIFTALTLEIPRGTNRLARKFAEPLAKRIFGGYPGLAYAEALRKNTLPANIEVCEFYFSPGKWLRHQKAQQSYTSINYTAAGEALLDAGVNVIAQLVASRGSGQTQRFSLSCNSDVTTEILPALRKRAQQGTPFVLVGEVNDNLPYMFGDADRPAADFDLVLDDGKPGFTLFSPPKRKVSLADHAAGLHTASLVRDGGTLQIGIGSLGDAVVHGLILRQQHNARFADAVKALSPDGSAADEQPETSTFDKGLYGASEMFVDGFLDLYRAGVLKRRVADDAATQERINAGKASAGDDGVILHGGFFLGPSGFYKALREMPDDERRKFSMTSVGFINQLYGDQRLKTAQRRHARFINSAMMVTLLGHVVSDALEDGRVVSGVGGQFDFVAQSQALPDARSIIVLNATRESASGVTSNIRWNYGHVTVPRHLREIVVTEYGVARLRSLSDRDTIAAMLNICDSRFQEGLLAEAKQAGKIESDYRIPEARRQNTPEGLAAALAPLQREGLLSAYPFGTDLTDDEQRLVDSLLQLKAMQGSKRALMKAVLGSLLEKAANEEENRLLERMGLRQPKGLSQRLERRLLLQALRRQ